MQLNRKRVIRAGLNSACITLLSNSHGVIAHENNWEYESGLLFFSEGNRTSGIEWIIEGRFEQDNDEQLNLRVEFDSIVGSSPNGVPASNQTQTFTSASGEGSYTVPANTLPLDPDYNDQRLGIAAKKIMPLSSERILSYGGAFAQEFDYFNVDLDIEIQQALNQKNTMLNYGLWTSYNRIHPVGGIPIGLATMAPADTFQPRSSAAKSKNQLKAWAGITLNVDRSSRINFNAEVLWQDGYLTDPYKLVGVVDDVNLLTLGEPVNVIYENRPELRNAYSLSTSYKHFIKPNVINLSLRLYSDDWGIQSHTVELGYRIRHSDASYWEPLVRIYHQTAADFYRHSLAESETIPEHVSADFRLAEFTAFTIGTSYGSRPNKNRKSEWKFLYYQQNGEHSPASAIGAQTEQDLFPTLRTIIVQYVYTIEW